MKILRSLTRKRIWVSAAFLLLWLLSISSHSDTLRAADGEITFIDTHNHSPFHPECVYDPIRLQDVVLGTMNAFGIEKTLFMPAPLPANLVAPCGFDYLARMVREYPARFAFLRGGDSLNPMIQQVVLGQMTLQEALPRFIRAANDILRDGAVGFGEMAAEHFSFRQGHPYISAPPDHRLFLLLADLAAGHDVPIDLHMEALTQDTARTDICEISADICWTDADGNVNTVNPDTFPENITAFKNLLNHNPHAKVIWVHAGWDNTGQRTVALMRGLLERHPNLYIQLRPLRRGTGRPNPILAGPESDRRIRGEWRVFISDFPDRFIIGVDSFYVPQPGEDDEDVQEKISAARQFVNLLAELSPDLARKVARDNAVRIYRLDEPMICHRAGTPAEQTLRLDADALQGHLAHGDFVGPCG